MTRTVESVLGEEARHSPIAAGGERKGQFGAFVRRRLPLVQFVLDGAAWVLAVLLATHARFDFDPGPVNEVGMLWATVLAIALQGVIGCLLGLYRRQYNYGSFEEVRALGLSVAGVSLVLLGVARAFGGTMVPRSVPVIAACVALVVALAVRSVARLVEERSLRPVVASSEPVIVLGAGNAGGQIVRTMLRSHDSRYRPVALLDDDPQKSRLRIEGLRVLGTRHDIIDVAGAHRATSVLVAIPSASGSTLREITTPLVDAGLKVLVLPPVDELFGTVRLSDIRPVTAADLLGRNPADIDTAAIAGYIKSRRVLVTGAGGSIGSELCRQLHQYDPAVLVMLDRDESGLHRTQLSIEGRAMMDSPLLALADIRDRDRVFEIFQQHRPEVVFHAAALKHLPLLELHPEEAWKSNVVGTQHVLQASEALNVVRFVNISTDKAADPTSVLGYSKRVCERLTAAVAASTSRPFVSVRFGNVLGSTGSMLSTFESQVANGGPITVTHPEVTRFFMTVEEAVALTIQAGAIGLPGEVLVLDMGRPVRIVDVARRLAEQADTEIDIEFTGLRPAEKLHEVLLGEGEVDRRPNHPLVSQVPVPALRFEDARAACSVNGRLAISAVTVAAAALWGLDGHRATPVGDVRLVRGTTPGVTEAASSE